MDNVAVRSAAVARLWHGSIAAVIAAALILQLGLTLTSADGEAAFLVANLFSFFTIQSNILLCVVSALLAVRPDRGSGGLWRVARLDSLICITVTGIVFVTVLRGLEDLSGLREATNVAFHYVAPLAALVGWFLFGPRPQLSLRTVGLALIFPVAWGLYTLIRGELVDWYPYPFIDVAEHGYGTVAANIGLVAAVFAAVGMIYLAGDRRLAAAPREVAASQPR